ncbi:MAG: hypothetical protein ABH951_01170 [Patescibacteria group bacterium]
MAIILTLFFLSLSGIIYMIGNKLIILQKEGNQVIIEKPVIKIPDLQEFKHLFIKNSRKYGFILLVLIIRFSVISSHFIKRKSKEIGKILIEKIKKITTKKRSEGEEKEVEQKEVSNFLRKMSDYKNKIKKIKDKIKEEEGIE